jgi:hypothetical protein
MVCMVQLCLFWGSCIHAADIRLTTAASAGWGCAGLSLAAAAVVAAYEAASKGIRP